MPEDVRVAFAASWPMAVKRLLDIVKNSDNEAVVIKAAELILNRACGLPTERGAIAEIAEAKIKDNSPMTALLDGDPDIALQSEATEATRAAIAELDAEALND